MTGVVARRPSRPDRCRRTPRRAELKPGQNDIDHGIEALAVGTQLIGRSDSNILQAHWRTGVATKSNPVHGPATLIRSPPWAQSTA